MNILAIDQGTSSTKALVVSPDGVILAEAEIPVHPVPVDAGGVEQDPEELWTSVVAAGREAVSRAAVPVAAVGLANQGETVLAWDRDSGAPLSSAISWQDRRAAGVCTRLESHAMGLHVLTGLPVDPYFAAPKMTWLREQRTRDGVCTTTDTWLLHRLSGAYVTDASTASRTMLLDLDALYWSPDACSVFDIDHGSLPEIVDNATVVGMTSAFGPSVPVAGLAVDQQAALFAQACFEPGQAKCTYGTGAFLLATLGPRANRSHAGLVTCVAWRFDGETTYCLDGQVYTAGAAVSWLQQIGLIRSPADLDTLPATAADANDVVFIPALAGLAAPFWRPAARGTFAGLSLATERTHIVRAVIDGIAAQVAWLARAVAADLDGSFTRMRVDGGLTRSRTLMQAQADLLQVPIEVYPSPHATALGVAALARMGIGAAKQTADAIGPWQPAATYVPQIPASEAERRLRRWRDVAEATMSVGEISQQPR